MTTKPNVNPDDNIDDNARMAESSTPALESNPFADLEKLKISQNFLETGACEPLLLTVPVRRPGPDDWFRVKPGLEPFDCATIEYEREHFLVVPELATMIQSEVKMRRVFIVINSLRTVTLWPARIPGLDGKTDEWMTSALKIAKEAETQWMNMRSNQNLGAYVGTPAPIRHPDPVWPKHSLNELLEKAFKNRLVTTPDHIILQKRRGERF